MLVSGKTSVQGTCKAHGRAPVGLRTKRHLMMAASVTALALAAPEVIFAPVQAMPAGCSDAVTTGTPNNADGVIDAGETITCLSPPDPISEIATSAADVTIVIGDATTPTSVSAQAPSETNGVRIENGGSVDVRNAASSVTGIGSGIKAYSSSSALTITSDGTISGGQDGIYAVTFGGALSITSDGVISGGRDGINAGNYGPGDLSIFVHDVIGVNDGIIALANGSGSLLSIAATGKVQGGDAGIRVNPSNGDVYINVQSVAATGNAIDLSVPGADTVSVIAGDVESTAGHGIYVEMEDSDVSVTTTGSVNAHLAGIFVTQPGGTGSVSVDVNDVYSATDRGIAISSSTNGTGVSVTARGTVEADRTAINVIHLGTGSATVDAAAVYSATGSGILVSTFLNGNGASVTASGPVVAEQDAIFVNDRGTADTSITVADVTSRNGDGIDAYSASGALSVTSSGTVSGGRDGINARNYGNGGVSIAVHDVDGVNNGIWALSFGTAGNTLSISATGEVQGGTAGVNVNNIGNNDVYIDVQSVTAAGNAIDLFDRGNDTASIIAGDVESTAGHGIYVDMDSSDVSVTTTGTVNAHLAGIFVTQSNGTGSVTVDVNDVYSATDRGIAISSSAASTGVSVTARGTVNAEQDAIFVNDRGTSDTTITVVDATSRSGDGIDAYSAEGALTITSVGSVTGGNRGITARQNGGGDLTIDVNTVYALSGGGAGIRAYNTPGGLGLSITAAGTVSSADGHGIDAANFGAGNLVINTANITAGLDGILVTNSGSGSATITAGEVTSRGGMGIVLNNSGSALDASITVNGAIVASGTGIDVTNLASADVTVKAIDVTSSGDEGISVFNSGSSAFISSTGTISSFLDGIDVVHLGNGALTIQANNIYSSDDSSAAIDVFSSASGGLVSIATTGTVRSEGVAAVRIISNSDALSIDTSGGEVFGAVNGIEAQNTGSGATTINVANAVTGQTGFGIWGRTANGAEITIRDGGSVTGATWAIQTDSSGTSGGSVNDIVNLNDGGAIFGDVNLLAGDDVFNVGSDQFTTVYGGDGTDTANFSASGARVINASGTDGSIQEFEIFNFNGGGFELSGDHTVPSAMNFNTGTNRLSGTLTSTQTTIAEGATLNAGDGSRIIGDLDVDGTLDIGDSPGTSVVDGDVTFGPNSTLPIEIAAESDLLVSTGTVTLDGELQVLILGGVGIGTSTRTIIDAETGISGTFSSFQSADGLLLSNSFDVDSAGFDVTVTTTVNPIESVDGLNGNERNVGANLIDLLAQPLLDQDFAVFINAVGGISDAGVLASTLAELHPEGFDAGLRFLSNSQNRFLLDLINGSGQVPVAPLENQDGAYFWTSAGYSGLSQGSSQEHAGFKGDAYEFSAGVSDIPYGRFQLGFAGGYATFSGETKSGLSDDVDASIHRLAASAHREVDGPGLNGQFDAAVTIAAGKNDLTMNLSDPASGTSVAQNGKADFRSAGLAALYTITGMDDRVWKIQPHMRAGVDVIKQIETTVGSEKVTALTVSQLNNARGHVGVGASVEHRIGKALSLNASATGVQYFGDTQNVFDSRFAAAPDGAPAFETTGAKVRRKAELRAGFTYAHESGFDLSADAFGEIGDVTAYTGRVELSRRF